MFSVLPERSPIVRRKPGRGREDQIANPATSHPSEDEPPDAMGLPQHGPRDGPDRRQSDRALECLVLGFGPGALRVPRRVAATRRVLSATARVRRGRSEWSWRLRFLRQLAGPVADEGTIFTASHSEILSRGVMLLLGRRDQPSAFFSISSRYCLSGSGKSARRSLTNAASIAVAWVGPVPT